MELDNAQVTAATAAASLSTLEAEVAAAEAALEAARAAAAEVAARRRHQQQQAAEAARAALAAARHRETLRQETARRRLEAAAAAARYDARLLLQEHLAVGFCSERGSPITVAMAHHTQCSCVRMFLCAHAAMCACCCVHILMYASPHREAQVVANVVQRIVAMRSRHAALTAQLQQCCGAVKPNQKPVEDAATQPVLSCLDTSAPLAMAEVCCAAVEQSLDAAAVGIQNAVEATRVLQQMQGDTNPHAENVQRFSTLVRAHVCVLFACVHVQYLRHRGMWMFCLYFSMGVGVMFVAAHTPMGFFFLIFFFIFSSTPGCRGASIPAGCRSPHD